MNLLHQIASGAKDLMLEKLFGAFLNAKQITEPETKTTVRLDAKQHRLFLHLYLKGEASPTKLKVRYRITPDQLIEICEIETEKDWISNIASLFVSMGLNKFDSRDLFKSMPSVLSQLSHESLIKMLNNNA